MKKLPVCLACAALLAAPPALADEVVLQGNTLTFIYDDLLEGLFGVPTVLGDSLYFTPTVFDASALNGVGYDLVKSTLNIKVMAKSGYDLDSVSLLEAGDYLLLGAGTSVDVGGQLRAFDLATPSVFTTSSIVASSLTTTGLPTQDWTASAAISLDGASWIEGSGINLTIENILLALSTQPATGAFIEKKYVGLSFETTLSPVPEPGHAMLILSGLSLLGFVVRRRGPAAMTRDI